MSGKIFSSIVLVLKTSFVFSTEIVSSNIILSPSESSKPSSKTTKFKFSKVGMITLTAINASMSKLISNSLKILSISAKLSFKLILKLRCSTLKYTLLSI